MKKLTIIAIAASLAACNSGKMKDSKKALPYPNAKTVDSADVFYGDTIPDPYRWLEDYSSPDAKKWIAAENKLTNSYLDKIPFLDSIKKDLKKLMNYGRIYAPKKHGDWYYFYKNTGLQNQSVIYRMKSPNDTANAEIFLDPNTFSKDGSVTLQGTAFTKDGSLMGYLISHGGSDWRDAIILDTKTKQPIDTVKDIKFSGIAWKGNTGFYYSTYEIPKGENKLTYKTTRQSIFYHQLNTPQPKDKFIFGGNKNPFRYCSAYLTEDEKYLVITGANTTSNNTLYFQDLTKKNAPIVPIVENLNSTQYIEDNHNDTLYIYTNLDAPNYRLVKVNAANPTPKNWKDVIPETKNVLEISTAGNYLFATYMVDVKNEVFQYDYNGKMIRQIALPTAGTVGGFGGLKNDTDLYYTFTSFTYPSTIYHYNIETGKSDLYWKPDINFNPDDYETKQVFYKSKDGIKVPMYIVYKKGLKLNGKNPTMLYGYGGFNISLMPSFSSTRLVWLEHGGIYAQPNIRGGGEYGQKWHLAGTKMHKQNVFDDFIAAGEYLIKSHYTSSSYLAIKGGSNGGLLVGAVMTERPDLMQVALPSAGVLDMLRYNKFTAGAGWATDYGTAEDSKAMFHYLLGYSPLHNVKKGVHYPATLVWAADHDDRVEPGMSFKFAATLQADNTGNNPILMQIAHNVGHFTGMDLSKEIDFIASKYAFAWYNMGVNPYKK